MKKTLYCATSILILLTFTTLVQAATLTVLQKDKQFVPVTLKIKVGDSVNFQNEDPFYHNVFSLSDTKNFDLGSFPKGQFKTVVFDKAGKVNVECAIHPDMHLVIDVTK
ncbi:MAG: plastocyanin/azurin family copper-binding protein [Gallionella sp.]